MKCYEVLRFFIFKEKWNADLNKEDKERIQPCETDLFTNCSWIHWLG